MNILQKIDKYLLEKCDSAVEWLWIEFEITKLSLMRGLTAILILIEIGYGVSHELKFGLRLLNAFIPVFFQIVEESTIFRLTNKLQNGICLVKRQTIYYQFIRLIMLALALPVGHELFQILLNIFIPVYFYFSVALISEKPPRRKLQYAPANGIV